MFKKNVALSPLILVYVSAFYMKFGFAMVAKSNPLLGHSIVSGLEFFLIEFLPFISIAFLMYFIAWAQVESGTRVGFQDFSTSLATMSSL